MEGAQIQEKKHLVNVQPEISPQLVSYLQPGQYPEPKTGSFNIVPNTNEDVIIETNNVLQTFAYWLIIAHAMCEYSFTSRLSRKRRNLVTVAFQFNSAPMKMEYSDGETWYYDINTVIVNGLCNFIPVEYDFTVDTERISTDTDKMREDTVYTIWGKFLFPGENAGFVFFDLLNKNNEKVASDGVFQFSVENLFIYAKLVLKKIDPNYEKDNIHFRVPELTLDYDFTKISANVARDPKFDKKDGDSSTPKLDIDKNLADFFAQQMRQKKLLIQRIAQDFINQIGLEMMKATSVSQCLCILNQALSERPAKFDKCTPLFNRLATEVYFLVNDKNNREFIMNFYKNSLPDASSIFLFNRGFYTNEYATIDSIYKYPSAEKDKSALRSLLVDEKASQLKILDDIVA